MPQYSALVHDGKRTVYIRNQEYSSKAKFIYDLRRNGYSVNPRMVKPSDVFTYITDHTNMAPWDWELTRVPQ